MNMSEDDLKEVFEAQRRQERGLAPAWNPELLQRHSREASRAKWPRLWLPGLAALVVMLCIWSPWAQQRSLGDLKPLFAEAEAEPFLPSASAGAWPTDFLQPQHINLIIP
jgi:hypothetical protein